MSEGGEWEERDEGGDRADGVGPFERQGGLGLLLLGR